MRETTDTTSRFADKSIPDGEHVFTVKNVKKKYGGANKDKPFYVWLVSFKGKEGEQVLMPNMMGPLLKAIGCTEIKPGHYDWDTDAVEGKTFKATVSREPDKKDPSKMRQQMANFEEELPF